MNLALNDDGTHRSYIVCIETVGTPHQVCRVMLPFQTSTAHNYGCCSASLLLRFSIDYWPVVRHWLFTAYISSPNTNIFQIRIVSVKWTKRFGNGWLECNTNEIRSLEKPSYRNIVKMVGSYSSSIWDSELCSPRVYQCYYLWKVVLHDISSRLHEWWIFPKISPDISRTYIANA